MTETSQPRPIDHPDRLSDRRLPTEPGPPPGAADDPLERRAHERHVALEYRAWVAWWDGPQRLRTGGGRLLDIGRGGAAVELDVDLPEDHDVLFTLEGLSLTTGGVWARVVTVSRGRRWPYRTRLAFTEPCPELLYRSALEGVPTVTRPACGV